MSPATSFLAGGLFGIGLVVSGMTMPEKIVGFLDVFGAWDPTLLFVMAGAVLVHMTTMPLARRQAAPVHGGEFEQPVTGRPDAPLVAGSALFGVGWGLSGFCPGPAFVALASFDIRPAVFVAALVAGMAIHRALQPAEIRVVEESCG